jgi:anti-sigma factor RsiW
MWDAAYVLGSLSANDRGEFEAHLDGCSSCREGVAELSDIPALLGLLDRDEVVAIN